MDIGKLADLDLGALQAEHRELAGRINAQEADEGEASEYLYNQRAHVRKAIDAVLAKPAFADELAIAQAAGLQPKPHVDDDDLWMHEGRVQALYTLVRYV